MKLSPAQVERTVSQLQIEAIPDNHPLVPQLNRLFGEHTYFLDQDGLQYRGAGRRRAGRFSGERERDGSRRERGELDERQSAEARGARTAAY